VKLKQKLILLVVLLFANTIVVNAVEDIPREELVVKANKELLKNGKMDEEYFGKEYSLDDKHELSKNKYLVGMRNLIVYGKPHGDFKNDRYRELGFSMNNTEVSNYLYPNVPSSVPLYKKSWIKLPWEKVCVLKGVWGSKYVKNSTYDFNDDKDYNRSIKLGLREVYSEEDFPDTFLDREDLYKFVHVYQPPTSWSWGFGVMFHNNGKNYMTVPMSPDGLKGDISVEFEEPPSSVEEGDKVEVIARIKSTCKTDLIDENAPAFKWEITDATTNEPIPSVKYFGHIEKSIGNIEIPSNGETALLAEFNMPDKDVKIKFEINKDGTNPSEIVRHNNEAEIVITPALSINTSGDFNLDYNVLSKNVKLSLAEGKDIKARLSAPKGELYGDAWGELDIDNDTPKIFRWLEPDSIDVDEPAGTIIKHPIINTTLYRKDTTFDSKTRNYDNPIEGKWLDGPTSKSATGEISFEGTASANYKYKNTTINDAGIITTEKKTRTTHAAFNSGKDTRTISTKIYNGKPTISKKTFENKIDYNKANYLQKDLFWTSEQHMFDVVRWMCHENESGSLYGWTAVPGRYQRTFTQQNSGTIKWSFLSTMKNDYKRGREAARNMDYRRSEYDKAVFASDIKFKDVDYPIKSGYYFNPTGTYTFTVETVTYNTSKSETKDHKDLVDAVINSFRYESDLMYINNNKEPVTLQNEPIYKRGDKYVRSPAALTAKDPTGVEGVKMLYVEKSDYTKDEEEIKHSENSGEFTHDYLKEILEGYEESGTIESKNKYKYREYIKNGQNIFRITEKTTVTIRINPENKKVYTFINMPDGKYKIAAWIGDIKLSDMDNSYKNLDVLKGIYNFDIIEVDVNGTLYDDQDAIIGN